MKILRYRSVKKIAAAGVMLFMWIGSTMAVPVYAGTPNVEIQIPVSVQGAAGTIVLEPEKAGIPVPDRTELQIGKDEKQSFGPICYEEPEDYHYKIYQKSANVTDVTYDTAVYDVTVRVTSTEAGEPKAVVWGEKEGTEGKLYEIIFTNSVKEQGAGDSSDGKNGHLPELSGQDRRCSTDCSSCSNVRYIGRSSDRSREMEAEKRKLGNRGKEQVRSKCRSCSFSYGIIAVKNRKNTYKVYNESILL